MSVEASEAKSETKDSIVIYKTFFEFRFVNQSMLISKEHLAKSKSFFIKRLATNPVGYYIFPISVIDETTKVLSNYLTNPYCNRFNITKKVQLTCIELILMSEYLGDRKIFQYVCMFIRKNKVYFSLSNIKKLQGIVKSMMIIWVFIFDYHRERVFQNQSNNQINSAKNLDSLIVLFEKYVRNGVFELILESLIKKGSDVKLLDTTLEYIRKSEKVVAKKLIIQLEFMCHIIKTKNPIIKITAIESKKDILKELQVIRFFMQHLEETNSLVPGAKEDYIKDIFNIGFNINCTNEFANFIRQIV